MPHLVLMNHLVVGSINNKLHGVPDDIPPNGLIQKSEEIKILFYIQVYIIN